ncbi:AbrB/MazE/SpoVT family DNA-binding domain-containing protein [Umezawaea sp.]|uniref:AbrB/MazE/SpoVT family DNA-binding domain-containing protein n=1 Tax=Umezawaea sp. TaxID=1955258 RepID=UPI002ED691E1
MTAESIIPALVHPVRDTVASIARSGEISGLPLPRLATLPHERPMLYGMATLDRGGRFGDRRMMRALGWRSDEHLDVALVRDVVLIRPDEEGLFRVPPGLLAVVPAPVRHWCALSPGDRVLLVADLERGVLAVHTTTTLDRLVLAHHARVFGGDDA